MYGNRKGKVCISKASGNNYGSNTVIVIIYDVGPERKVIDPSVVNLILGDIKQSYV